MHRSEMGRLEFATPREAWGGEASDFTPLLAQEELLSYLSDVLGLGRLSLIEVEHTTAGRRSLDILAETEDQRRVAIENQYGQADHDHLTRGLAYAVAADCRALIVVAEHHRDEFVSVADYLNRVGALGDDDGVAVWLVRVRAVRRVGDTIWSPEFVVQSEPNEWEASVQRSVGGNLASLEEFYSKCVSSEVADGARTIIDFWTSLPNAWVNHQAKTSVALYHSSPAKPTAGTAVFGLGLDGGLHIKVGYIRETAGLYRDGNAEELDEAIARFFPESPGSGKNYFHGVADEPDAIPDFLLWLSQRLNSAMS